MAEKKEKVFADGFVFKRREDAPDFVIGEIAVKVDEAIVFLKDNVKTDGWVNLNINISKAGKPYIELDTFVPNPKFAKQELAVEVEEEEDEIGDLPF